MTDMRTTKNGRIVTTTTIDADLNDKADELGIKLSKALDVGIVELLKGRNLRVS